MKKTIKSGLALLLCCVLLTVITACGSSGDQPTTSSNEPETSSPEAIETGFSGSDTDDSAVSAQDTLTIAVSQDSASLDPLYLSGGASFRNVSTMYAEPLYDFDANGEKIWILATGIDIDSPTQWTVHLREGVSFTNGNPFTADDVLFTFNKDNFDSARSDRIVTLDFPNCRKINDYTVELNFTAYDLTAEPNIALIQIYDAESFDAEVYSQNPVGTGPYYVTEYVINSHCYLTMNENYWGSKAKIKNLRFRVIDEPAQIVNAVEMGTVDVATIPLQDVDFVKSLPEYKIDLISNGSVSVLQFNTTALSVLNNRDARRAVCHAVDKEAIINLTYYGYASIPSWSLSTNLVDYNENFSNMDETYSIGYDIELAKQYAEQAGLVGKEIRIVTNGSTTAVTTAEIMQQNLADIGVNAVIINYDPASFFSISLDTSAYDIYLFSYWVPSFTAAQNYNGWVYRLPNYNEGTWEGIDRVMELASDLTSVFDNAERQTAIDEITEIVQREAIWYAINEPQTVIAYNTNLSGVKFMQNLNTYYGDWYWIA